MRFIEIVFNEKDSIIIQETDFRGIIFNKAKDKAYPIFVDGIRAMPEYNMDGFTMRVITL